MKSPNEIAKSVIQTMKTDNKDVAWAIATMIELWKDAYPVAVYVDDEKALAAAKKATRKTAVDVLRADISFEDAFGADILDDAAAAGIAVSKSDGTDITEYELPMHRTDGLRRSDLEKSGFKVHGGVIFTVLNPMLDALKAKIRVGSHIKSNGQNLRIVETAEVTTWASYGKKLYTAVNAVIDG